MNASERPPVGTLIMTSTAPEQLAPLARLTEELGFGELWVAEDYFFHGGVAAAAICLGATERIPVGIGILSSVVRHPAVAAMEIATLARAFPGRLMPGFGLGVPFWIGQMGLTPPSQLAAVRECLSSVRRLLAGEELTEVGKHVTFDHVRLAHPLSEPLRVYSGLMGPKMLQLSGEVADGNIIGAMAPLEYVSWSREQMAIGAARAGRELNARCPMLALYAVGPERRQVKDSIRGVLGFYLSVFPRNAFTEIYGCADELEALVAQGGAEAVAREMPDRWVDDFTISGEPDECAARIRAYLDAGVDSVVLAPQPADRSAEIFELTAREVLSRIA